MLKVSVPSKVKNMNVKVFNLMAGVNETRSIVQNEPCECKCRLIESVRMSVDVGLSVNTWGSCKKYYM